MSAVVLVAPPYIPPQPPLQPGWERMELVWTGSDGSQWTFSDPRGGAFVTRGGVSGLLGDTKFEHKRDTSPAVDGAFYRGTNYGSRPGRLSLYVYHDVSTIEFVQRVDALWASMDPEVEGTMTIRIPGVRTRSIRLRLNAPDSDELDMDPAFFGWVKYSIEVQADLPFWSDPVIPHLWGAEDEADFFGEADPDVVYISSGTSLSQAVVRNPGDRPGWATTIFHGPFTSAVVDVDGSLIECPFALDEGEWVKVISDPRFCSVRDQAGADRFGDMGELQWRAFPPRSETPVTITIDDGEDAYVEMLLEPRYRRML